MKKTKYSYESCQELMDCTYCSLEDLPILCSLAYKTYNSPEKIINKIKKEIEKYEESKKDKNE